MTRIQSQPLTFRLVYIKVRLCLTTLTGYTPSRVAVLEEEEFEARETSKEYTVPPLIQVASCPAKM